MKMMRKRLLLRMVVLMVMMQQQNRASPRGKRNNQDLERETKFHRYYSMYTVCTCVCVIIMYVCASTMCVRIYTYTCI